MTVTRGMAMAALMVAVAVVYANSLDGPFIFDDHYSILPNLAIRSLRPLSAALNPPPADMSFCTRPFINLTMCADYALWGLKPRGYHLTSVAFHALAVLALFMLLRRTFLSIGRPETEAQGLGFAAALLWAVHPLNTAAVNYLSQRGELAVGLFFFLMLYALNRAGSSTPRLGAASPSMKLTNALEGEPVVSRARGAGLPWLLASVFFCLLGMGSKESMAAAPFLALAYDRIFLSASWKEVIRKRGLFYFLLALTWLWPLSKHLVFSPQAQPGVVTAENVRSYLLTQSWGLNRMIRLMLWPAPLVFDYGREMAVGLRQVWLSVAGLLLLAGVAGWALRRHPRIGFAGLCFMGLLAPAVLFPVTGQPIAEHRMYAPLSAGILLLVLGARALAREFHWSPRALPVALAAAVLLLGGVTVRRNAHYRSEVELLTDTIGKWPNNERAYFNRGLAHQRGGRSAAALADYERALELEPDYVNPLINRAKIRFDQQNFAAALDDLNRVLTLAPDWPEMLYRRSQIHLRRGSFREAADDLGRAVVLQPRNAGFLNDYAWVLATAPDGEVRNGPRARVWAERAVSLTRRHYRSLDILAAAHAECGRFEEARTLAGEALAQAVAGNDRVAAERLEQRLQSYRQNQPWRP